MSPRIHLLVSFDYEIFLGRNFASPEEVLFRPTRELFELLERIEVPATFFADVCSVWAHEKYGRRDYVDGFEQQLKEATQRGHDVELHLHPHWLGSTHQNGSWQVSTERMYLAELGFDDGPDAAPAVIRRGKNYLEVLLSSIDPAYRCLAFRAAGLALQPEEGRLVRALVENGIAIDSSIVKGVRMKMDTVALDYRHMPPSANWYIAPGGMLSRPEKSGLFEVPIATFQVEPSFRLRFLLRRAAALRKMRGTGISRAKTQSRFANLRTLALGNLRYLYGSPWFIFSCDTKGFDLDMLLAGFEDYVSRHRRDDLIFVSMINHPKLMFREQMHLLESLVRELKKRYGAALTFSTCRDLARQQVS